MTESRETVRASVIESVTIAASGAAVMIGSLLPWAYAKSFNISPGQNSDDLHAVTGWDFDGEIAFALGAIAIVLALVTHSASPIPVRLITVAVFVWATWIAVATIDLLSPTPSRMLPEDFMVAPGYGFGLIITVVAAVGGTLVSFAWLIRSQLRTS